MIQIETKFEKGEKVFVLTSAKGFFEVIEKEIVGITWRNYDEKEGEKLFYVIELDGNHRFVEDGFISRTKAELIQVADKIMPEVEASFEAELKSLQDNIKTLEETREKMRASVEDLRTFKPEMKSLPEEVATGESGEVNHEAVPSGEVAEPVPFDQNSNPEQVA